jgi:hypothetical protein
MDERYKISHAGRVSDELRAAFAQAEVKGLLPLAVRAARWIVEEMERTPDEFGESRDFLAYADIQIRVAFAAPLFVIFGIHGESRTVFVRKIGWLERG